MLVWIDAAQSPGVKIFGMTLLERHLQSLALAVRLGAPAPQIIVDLPPDAPAPKLPKRLAHALKIAWRRPDAVFIERLTSFLAAAGSDDVLLLDAATLVDQRLHAYLLRQSGDLAVLPPDTEESDAAVIRAAARHLLMPKRDGATLAPQNIADLARDRLAAGCLARLGADAFDGFIRRLRRTLPFYLFRIADPAAAAKAERFLFWSNYKGSTDIFTRYVYPPLVWLLLRPLARARIHPNCVTLLSVLLALAAIPLWSAGWFWTGFAMAYAMSVLDSVDGKLARLTFTDSRIGNFLDHGLDLVHPPFWYLSWAYGLGLGSAELGWETPLGVATISLFCFYILDRIFLAIYPRFFQRGFHTHSKFDSRMRSFIARRNIALPVFLIGYVLGEGIAAIQLIALWQIATAAYHGIRIFWIIVIAKAHRRNLRPVDIARQPRRID